jgi:LCP family protein required for cell wall assembly
MTAAATGVPDDGRFAFLLLGYGGGGHDGAYLTDSMMVVIVDPSKKSLALLSVPRDSWVPISFDGKTSTYNKINTAYAFGSDSSLYKNRLDRYKGDNGAGNVAVDTVSRILGIPIKYYLALDFQGFRQMIDAVGGIDVNVPDSFSTSYPMNDDPSINPGWTVIHFTKGIEHMGGERAIEFARARDAIDNASEVGDFARSRRQRIIMQAFKARLLAPGGIIHLPQLLGIATKHVDTNYGIPDIGQLSQLIATFGNATIYESALSTSNYLEVGTGPEGTYILTPTTSDHSWAQIQAFTRRLWEDPATAVTAPHAVIRVANHSGSAATATLVATKLTQLGYLVGDPLAGPTQASSAIVDRTGGQANALIQQLSQDLGRASLPVTSSAPNSTPEIELDLGTDATSLNLTTNSNQSAPTSNAGVVQFGAWSP